MTEVIAAANNTRINIGDRVMVAYPVSEQTNNPAHKLDGQQFVVKSVHRVSEKKNQRVTRAYYELYKAVSDAGVHYAFLEDELIKL